MEIPQFDPFVDAITRRFEADDPSVESKRLEQANVQRIAAAFESLGRGDIDSFCGGFTEDVELEIHAPAELRSSNWPRDGRSFARPSSTTSRASRNNRQKS